MNARIHLLVCVFTLPCLSGTSQEDQTHPVQHSPLIATVRTTGQPLANRRLRPATSVTNRPPLLLFIAGRSDGEKEEYFTEYIWSYAGGYAIKHGITFRPPSAGASDEAIAANLNYLVEVLRSGWWRKEKSGYVVCLDPEISSNVTFTNRDRPFPRCVLFSPGLQQSARLLEELTGLKMDFAAKDYVSLVEERDPVNLHASGRVQRRLFHFSTEAPLKAEELISELASFHGCASQADANSFAIIDADPPQMKAMVAQVVSRFRKAGPYPWPWNYTLPKRAAQELIPYLASDSEDILQQVIISLRALDQKVGKTELFQIARNSKLTKMTRAMAATALAQAGEEEILGLFEELSDAEYQLENLIIGAGWVHTELGFQTQRRLLRKHQPLRTGYEAGTLEIESIPESVSVEQARELLQSAVLFANIFARSTDSRMLGTTIDFSFDGKTAMCRLTKGYHRGPLNGAGSSFNVYFARSGDSWFIVGNADGGQWVE